MVELARFISGERVQVMFLTQVLAQHSLRRTACGALKGPSVNSPLFCQVQVAAASARQLFWLRHGSVTADTVTRLLSELAYKSAEAIEANEQNTNDCRMLSVYAPNHIS